jgi:CheY-like chemotaxis protein
MEAIGNLAGGVAHDFNNLVTAIQGYTDLATVKVDEADPVYRDLKQIRVAAVRASELTRQLLLFSRKQPMELAKLSMNQVVSDLLKMLDRLIGENIRIDTALSQDLWRVKADAGSIEQAITNMAVNARDAMPQGGTLTIRTENVTLDDRFCESTPELSPGDYVRLTVRDTGAGMDSETIEHLFEPFFTTKGSGKGSGLGLAVVYGIVRQHEGWVHVQSQPNAGSTFDIYLPAVSEPRERTMEDELRLRPAESPDGPSDERSRILVVEDEDLIRDLASTMLRESGYVVFEAASAKEAIEIFDRERGEFNLVLSDIVLPDRSGLGLVDHLLSRNPDLDVLMRSNPGDDRSEWPTIRARGFGFLHNPNSLPELLRAVRETMEPAH